MPPNSTTYYNDHAISQQFIQNLLPTLVSGYNAVTPTPWFAAVSFVNPHDISGFPYTYNLAGTTGFGPANSTGPAYPAPNTLGYSAGPHDNSYLYPLPKIYNSSVQPPSGWNVSDNVSVPANGKPGIQIWYQSETNYKNGQVKNVGGWLTFLDYYLWMQKCVDDQIGLVLSNFFLPGNFEYNSAGIMIIFLSDHGDFGGSHCLHNKTGALYDEVLNVPLYISFPGQRVFYPPNAALPTPTVVPQACSSVDILPYLYGTALKDDFHWRFNTSAPIHYLNGRESIRDFILSSNTCQQRRISSILNNGGAYFNNQKHQPYVLSTMDEYPSETVAGSPVPPHAIAFRTVDLTVSQLNPDNNYVNGGGKIGIYSFWPSTSAANPTQPDPARAVNTQYEFYDYTGGNFGETGNNYTNENSLAMSYVNAFNDIAADELYYVDSAFAVPYNAALNTWINSQTCVGGSPMDASMF